MGEKSAGVGLFHIPTAPAALTATAQSGSANTYGSAASFGTAPSTLYIVAVNIGVSSVQIPTYVAVQILVAASIVGEVIVGWGVGTGATGQVISGRATVWPPIPVTSGAAITVKTASSVASAVAWGVSLECIAQSNVVDDGVAETSNVTQVNAHSVTDTASGVLDVNAKNLGGTSQTGRDVGASVLLSTGTGTGQLDFTSGVVKANLTQILATALTETAGLLAGGFKKLFNVASPTGTLNSIPDAVAGAAGGLFIAGTNAATSVTTALTANITGNLSGSVGSVTGAVGSVTGAVGSVTGAVGSVSGNVGGNVGGNVVGSVASVTARVTANTDQWAGTTIPAPAVTGVPSVDVRRWLGNAPLATTISGVPIVDISYVKGGLMPAPATTGVPVVDTSYFNGNGAETTIVTGRLKVDVEYWKDGVVPAPSVTGVPIIDLKYILGSVLTETAGQIAAAFKQFFNIASPTSTMNEITLVDTATTATTATNLTNAPANGDFTAAMKTSLNAATPVVTVSDKTGFSLSVAGIKAIFDQLTSALTTVGSVGKLLVDNIDAAISSRTKPADTQARVTLVDTLTTYAGNTPQTGDAYARIGAAGAGLTALGDTRIANLDAAVTSRLAPTVAARTLDVSATGEAGVDWANIGAPTTTVNLSGTTLKDVTDVETAIAAVQADTDDMQTRLPSALVGGKMDSHVNDIAANAITATSIATDAIDADVLAADAVAEIVYGTWDEAIAGHLSAGSTGAALNAAGSAGDPWAISLPAAYGAGTAGYIVGNELDAKVSSRSTLAQSDILSDATPFAGADVDAKISTRSTLTQAQILSDATPFAGADIDAKISSRSTLAQSDILSDATPFAGGDIDAKISTRSTFAGGAVASVTGNIGGNVAGSVASVVGNVGGNVTGSVGSVLASVSLSGATEIAIANAVAALTRDGYTWSEILGIMGAAVAGKVSGSPVNPVFRALDDSADRISAVTTVAGDRTAITLTP